MQPTPPAAGQGEDPPTPGCYRTRPIPSREMPRGVPYIVANEAAERFSYYGMRAVLVVFMTRYLMSADGTPAPMSEAEAKSYFHLFASAVYFFPVLGALVSDALLGKYRTIMALSIVYCLGHLALALDDTRMGLAVGLTLVAVGSGGIKPCVSAHVGDQFGRMNRHLIEKVFSWFYFAINLGAFLSSVLTPLLLDRIGPQAAFGLPGALMLFATWVFWLGRREFIHVPPGGMRFLRESFGAVGLATAGRLLVIYAFVAMFWALYDQTGSAWVLQAQSMDLYFAGIEWLPSQVQAVNPVLILLYIPLFSVVIYPWLGRRVRLTAMRKIAAGLFLTVVAFLVPAWVEWRITVGAAPNVVWHLLAYVILTAAEVLVSITCLEFSYTQAPRTMKSLIMSFYLLSVSVGNLFTSAVNYLIQNDDGTTMLAGPSYYLFFAGVMLATALLFLIVAARYQERTYLQDDPEALAESTSV